MGSRFLNGPKGMAMAAAARATWKGFLKLALVSCPVKLIPGVTAANEIHFHNLNPRTHNRIALRPHDPESGDEVPKEQLVKGYEYEKGQFVVLEKPELDAVKVVSDKTLELEEFIDADEMDVIHYDRPYFIVPDGAPAEKTYRVIAAAIAEAGKIGIGRVVMQARERVVAIEPREHGLLMNVLRSKDDLVDEEAFFEEIGEGKLDPEMIELAGVIIDKKKGEFDAATFADQYQEELGKLIEAKARGETFEAPKVKAPAKVVDLKEALRRAIEEEGGGKPPAGRKTIAARAKPAARKPAAKAANTNRRKKKT
jgi:DNA end-binding protein Ku